jgi:hypothetical protein
MSPLICSLDQDLANLREQATFALLNPPLVKPEDRELHLALTNSLRRNAWRLKAGLPLRANPKEVETWHAWLGYRFWLARWGRRHPHHPINRALVAH